MKRIVSVLLAAAMVLSLSACGSKFDPKESGIYVKRDGSIIDVAVETFDKDYYSEDELETYVEEQVVAYNKENSSYDTAYQKDVKEKEAVLPVAIDKLEVKSDTAKLHLNFASVSAYLAFNETRVGEDAYFASSLANQAVVEGDVKWINNKNQEEVDQTTALSGENHYLVGLDFASRVTVQGTIVYVTDNVNVLGNDTFTTDGEEVAYVVYKK